ncbi:hypothetical protein [Hyphomicrobium sp.]|uniref:hypothetical protein n=1 Tax=Hyphomicrobium sp. TaxID=82 RepID=UPI0025BDF4E2|nr:hypothetical protein [Hyphomicrobium sp.]
MPSSENTFRPMELYASESGPIVSRAQTARTPHGTPLFWMGKFLRILLATMIFVAGAHITASHTKAHFSGDRSAAQTEVSNLYIAGDQGQSDSKSTTPNGMEHHFCSCPCLQSSPSRSNYEDAFLGVTRIRYPSYLDAIGASREPDPLRKPPRLSIGA